MSSKKDDNYDVEDTEGSKFYEVHLKQHIRRG